MAEEINANLDTTPLPPNNLVAQDPQSAELAGYVRTKTFGRDVRESIARSIELNSTRSKNAEELASETLQVTETATSNMANQVELIRAEKDAVIANATQDSEVILARGGKTTLGQRLDETDEQLAQITVNANQFDSIQDAIDYVHSNGSGKVLISDAYEISEPIHVKRDVEVECTRNSRIFYTEQTGNVFIIHRDSFLTNPKIRVNSDYNDTAILITSPHMYWNKLTNIKGVDLVKLDGHNPLTTNCVALELHSTPFVMDGYNHSGYSYIKVDTFFSDGFNIVVKMTTDSSGWLTSHIFNNFNASKFTHLIHVEKLSEESLGIASNIFDNWHVQLSDSTRELFKDFDSTNIYKNFKIWDMHAYPDATMGVISGNFIEPEHDRKSQPMLLLNAMYGSNGYKFLGTFRRLTSGAFFAVLRVRGRYLDIDTLFNISLKDGEPFVTRKHFGRTTMTHTRMAFFIETHPNGTVDLYLKANGDYDVSLYLTDYLGFTGNPDPYLFKKDFPNAVEIERNEDIHFSVKPASKVRSSSQSIEPNATTPININNAVIDNYFSYTHANPGKITCAQTGVYQLIGRLHYSGSNLAGEARLLFRKNGNTYTNNENGEARIILNGGSVIMNASIIVQLEKGDYVELCTKHTNAVSVNVLGELSMFKISD